MVASRASSRVATASPDPAHRLGSPQGTLLNSTQRQHSIYIMTTDAPPAKKARSEDPQVLWRPGKGAGRNLARFIAQLRAEGAPDAPAEDCSYHDLWKWSVEHLDAFWSASWKFLGMVASVPPTPGRAVVPGPTPASYFTGATFFEGARLKCEKLPFSPEPTYPALREPPVTPPYRSPPKFRREYAPLPRRTWRRCLPMRRDAGGV